MRAAATYERALYLYKCKLTEVIEDRLAERMNSSTTRHGDIIVGLENALKSLQQSRVYRACKRPMYSAIATSARVQEGYK